MSSVKISLNVMPTHPSKILSSEVSVGSGTRNDRSTIAIYIRRGSVWSYWIKKINVDE